jgi:hypothetical protein
MPEQVCNGALLKCSMGMAPSTFVVLPAHMVQSSSQPAANIMDNIPMKNIMPFGMCKTQSNPMVAAATAAAMGVLTPMPCIPLTTGPWSPGSSTTMIGNQKALNDTSTCKCAWTGTIEITNPGQSTIEVD